MMKCLRFYSFLSFSLLIITLIILITNVGGDSLLVLGDSVDRQSTIEWCEMKKSRGFNVSVVSWGPFTIAAEHQVQGRMGTWICRTPSDSVAYSQIYGSNATGPYRNYGLSPKHIYEHTTARVNLSISAYVAEFGVPDRIVFQTTQWDVAHLANQVRKFNITAVTIKFKQNTIDRIDEILLLVPNTVDVGLRTSPRTSYNPNLMHRFNTALREIATERNVSLYDFDQDVWSMMKFDFGMEPFLFRDWIHPRYPYSAMGADKMIGRQYSNLASFKNGLRRSDYYNKRFDTPSNLTTVQLWRDTNNNATFYYNAANKSRHTHPGDHFLRALRLGPGDVREFNGKTLYDISIQGGDIPNYYIDGTIVNATLNATLGQQLYYYSQAELRIMSHNNSIAGLGKKQSDVLQLDSKDSLWLSDITIGKPVLSIYNKTEDWLIRQINVKDVYLVRNGYRYVLNNGKQVTDLNLTFDDVVTVSVEEGAHFLPLSKKPLSLILSK